MRIPVTHAILTSAYINDHLLNCSLKVFNRHVYSIPAFLVLSYYHMAFPCSGHTLGGIHNHTCVQHPAEKRNG